VSQYVQGAPARGIELFIACAGMAAHLAGAVAAQTLLPVIGVPLQSGGMQGLDALLATVQMPPGIPVATVAVDGAKNAGYLAARILASKYPEITAKLQADLAEQRKRYDAPDKPRVR
jgi:5-(carboxyamino)imidazole ribonucleotide mutase